MKSYDELKAKMESIQQQIVETKKNERANELKEAKLFPKSLALQLGCLKVRWLKGGESDET